jgi:hypothetical protein
MSHPEIFIFERILILLGWLTFSLCYRLLGQGGIPVGFSTPGMRQIPYLSRVLLALARAILKANVNLRL